MQLVKNCENCNSNGCSTCQFYNGWNNRETWALNLWLSNDEGFYNTINEMVESLKEEFNDNKELLDEETTKEEQKSQLEYKLADRIREYIENDLKEYADETNHSDCKGRAGCIHQMFDDIGSLWRVDYHEIAKAWLEE